MLTQQTLERLRQMRLSAMEVAPCRWSSRFV